MAGKALLEQLYIRGFNQIVLKKLKILSAGSGSCLAELQVDKEHTNSAGMLHSGLSVTLVDVVSAHALRTHKRGAVPSVSVDMNLSYIKAAKLGEKIIIDAKTVRKGKTLSFSEVTIKNKQTGEVLVRGSHTQYLMQPNE